MGLVDDGDAWGAARSPNHKIFGPTRDYKGLQGVVNFLFSNFFLPVSRCVQHVHYLTAAACGKCYSFSINTD